MSDASVLVAGGTGRTGRHIVQKLIANGDDVLVMSRTVGRAREILGDKPELIAADATVPETLPAVFEGIDYCICAIGSAVVEGQQSPEEIDYQGVVNLVDAAKEAGIKHFVLLSSMAVTHDDHPLNEQFGNVLKWKLKGENHLRDSGLTYTVVRPGGLSGDPGGEKSIVFNQGDTIESGRIPRDDVAEVCVQALNNPHAYSKTFEIIGSEDDDPPTNFDAIFEALNKD
jgi:uncharacterized protein YbjT (DUF2867 family)